jgi:hypothetical protein
MRRTARRAPNESRTRKPSLRARRKIPRIHFAPRPRHWMPANSGALRRGKFPVGFLAFFQGVDAPGGHTQRPHTMSSPWRGLDRRSAIRGGTGPQPTARGDGRWQLPAGPPDSHRCHVSLRHTAPSSMPSRRAGEWDRLGGQSPHRLSRIPTRQRLRVRCRGCQYESRGQ